MKQSPEDKAARARARMIDKAREYGTDSYCRKFVAPVFQRIIRAEAAACPAGFVQAAIGDHGIDTVYRCVGQCICVTCGKVDAWDSGIKGMHTGHFSASRRNAILLLEENCAPQCQSCNYYRSGMPAEFRLWMLVVRGIETIERIESLKRTSVSFDRETLVDKKIEFSRRLKGAQDKMKSC